MGIQTAAVLFPVNTTTVDTGSGIDIRLLDSAEAGADDTTQTATFTHTQDSQGRVFDPASTTSANRSILSLQAEGWALRLAEDMTPADDTNCNAVLLAGTLTVNLRVNLTQSGGTYLSGTYGPNFSASLWRYNPSTDTGTGINFGTSAATTWNIATAGGDLGTQKNVAISIPIAAAVEFDPGEVLLIEIGFGTGTVPNPTSGTATFTCTLVVDNANTNITFAANQGIRTLANIVGSGAGVGSASGTQAAVLPTVGSAAGSSTASGAQQAEANMAGASSGAATATAGMQAEANMTGTAAGAATAAGAPAAVVGTVGTCDISAGGETVVVIRRPILDG